MLKVHQISKSYGGITPIKNISFTLEKGEIVGLLGANGAGKSTTMNMISGYFPPSAGSISLDGMDSISDFLEYKKNIGYLPEKPPLYQDMTAWEQLQMVCSVKCIPRNHQNLEIGRVSALCHIEDVLHRLNRSMSKGYRQRVGLAQALIGTPELLILDEPTAGLDPQQIIEFRQLIGGLKKEQTLIISSHILPEIAAVAGRVLVLNKGYIAADRSVDDLSNKTAKDAFLEARIFGNIQEIIPLIEDIDGVASIEVSNSIEEGCMDYVIKLNDGKDIRRELFYQLSEKKHPLMLLNLKSQSLEDFFITLTSHGDLEFNG